MGSHLNFPITKSQSLGTIALMTLPVGADRGSLSDTGKGAVPMLINDLYEARSSQPHATIVCGRPDRELARPARPIATCLQKLNLILGRKLS
jgi:hypothetical protein